MALGPVSLRDPGPSLFREIQRAQDWVTVDLNLGDKSSVTKCLPLVHCLHFVLKNWLIPVLREAACCVLQQTHSQIEDYYSPLRCSALCCLHVCILRFLTCDLFNFSNFLMYLGKWSNHQYSIWCTQRLDQTGCYERGYIVNIFKELPVMKICKIAN